MTAEMTLQIINILVMYCGLNGPGPNVELYRYRNWSGDRERSAVCFVKTWTCGHQVSQADVIPFEIHNCITKHEKGELK